MQELIKENEGLFSFANEETVKNELDTEIHKIKNSYEEEYERAKKEIEDRMIKQKIEYEEKLLSLETAKKSQGSEEVSNNFDVYLREVQNKNVVKEVEFEKERKRIAEMDKIIRRRRLIMEKLTKKLLKTQSTVLELNLMSETLERKVTFFLDLGPGYLEEDNVSKAVHDIVRVKVVNEEDFRQFFWDAGQLNDRYYIIKDMVETFLDTEKLPELDRQKDPFWDPEVLIDCARGYISLKPLAFLFDNKKNVNIFHEGQLIGEVFVCLEP